MGYQTPAGQHTVALTLSGYQPYSVATSVTPNTVSEVSAILQPTAPASATGGLSISSTPAGAQVFLDSVYMGITPLTLPGVSTGSHLILLKLTGYSDWEVSAQVAAGQTTPVTAILVPVTTPTPTQGPLPGMLALVALSIASVALWSRKR